jgi:hypothetical protein
MEETVRTLRAAEFKRALWRNDHNESVSSIAAYYHMNRRDLLAQITTYRTKTNHPKLFGRQPDFITEETA